MAQSVNSTEISQIQTTTSATSVKVKHDVSVHSQMEEVAFGASAGHMRPGALRRSNTFWNTKDPREVLGGEEKYWVPAGGTKKRNVKRLLKRNATEFQSDGMFQVLRSQMSKVTRLSDPFHGLVVMPTRVLLVIFMTVYVAAWMGFGVLWYLIAETADCGLTLETYRQAFYLSLETMTTIGYGVDDQYFNDCANVGPLLVIQCLTSTLLDCLLLGVLFMRFGLSSRRTRTMIFSDLAVLQVVNGNVQLKFRAFGMQHFPVLQATCQVHCVQHHATSSGLRVEARPLALTRPDIDASGGVVFLGLPLTVVHTIDADSPLAPLGLDGRDPTQEEVIRHLEESPYIEIICCIGGTVEHTGNTIEKRHSYTLDDIFWNRDFAPCIFVDEDGSQRVDFHSLHETVPHDPNAITYTFQEEDKAQATKAEEVNM